MKNIRTKKFVKAATANLILVVFFTFSFFSNQTASALDVPKIITRSQWGADESKMIWPIAYAKIEKIVIHHTASSNLVPDPDGSGEYKNMVNNIYAYHNGKKTWYDDNGEYVGFGDVGYNYLIDPNGNIYEGRFGGNGAVAGHVNGYNTGSVGISVIGRYEDYIDGENNIISSHPVTPAIKKSLESLVGWIAANNNIELGKITGFYGKNIDGLVGHKDLAPTVCPGVELYKQIDIIQNNAISLAKQYNNYAYQIGGDKAVYILADGYKIKFNSAKELPTAYQNNIVKPISADQLALYQYKNMVIYPDGSLLQKFDEPTVYYLENGKKRAMSMSGEEFLKMGFKAENLKNVFESDLKIYDDGRIIKYGPDESLLSDKNGQVYFMEKGQKRKFTSPQLFEYLNYQWTDIKENPELDFYLSASDMIYPDGTLAINNRDNKVYLIENKQRREITSVALFNALNYQWGNVISITEDEMDHFPTGVKMAYPNGTLIKANDSAAVYLIENGNRKEITSLTLFEKLGYNWSQVINIEPEEINNHPDGGRALYPNGTLIRPSDNPNVYLLEDSQKRKVTSLLLFEKLGYNWNDVLTIYPDESKEYSDGKNLTYPEGTLIRREGYPVVYKIENGTKKRFTSLTLFETTKSEWTDVLDLDKEEFMAYPDGGILKYPDGTLLRQIGNDKIYVMKNGQAEWIKSMEEFLAAKYKWPDIVEIAAEEMSLYINAENKKMENNSSADDSQNAGNNNDANNNDANNNSDNNISGEPLMRVAIYSTADEDVRITASGNYSVNYYNSTGTIYKTANKSAGEQTAVPYFDSADYVKFVPLTENVILEVLSYEDLSWNKETNDNKFRGNIEVNYSDASNKLWVVNELPLEDYSKGISEAANSSPEEYLKAFSTIARTYAMSYIKKGGKHAGEPFYLKNSRNGNGNDQHYKGYNFEMRAPQITAASELTAGYIINYNGSPIVAAYSSDSGGTTKSACETLSASYCNVNYAYLNGGVTDPENTEHDPAKVSASHGAGMSAVGAYQMAENGSLWQDIIKHYYLGVEVEKEY